MNFDWFSRERLTNKISIIAVISTVLYLALFSFWLSAFTSIGWSDELILVINLFGLFITLLFFTGAICGIVGVVKDIKAKKKPSKASIIAMLVNLVIALITVYGILWGIGIV